MCDIWRYDSREEISLADLDEWIPQLVELGVREVILTGGEALMHSEFDALCCRLAEEFEAVRLVTNGMLLARHAEVVADCCTSVRVSLDGPPRVHNRVRAVPLAFERMREGVRALKTARPDIRLGARCTVQAANFRYLRDTVDTALSLPLDYLSFCPTDVTSEAYNRAAGSTEDRMDDVAVSAEDLDALDGELTALECEHRHSFETGFILESAPHLRAAVLGHYRALYGIGPSPVAVCNAPWVSAVLEPDGVVRPCFFHRSLGNVREAGSIESVVNGEAAVAFRRTLDVSRDPVCQGCVCRMPLHACDCGWTSKPPFCDGTTCRTGWPE